MTNAASAEAGASGASAERRGPRAGLRAERKRARWSALRRSTGPGPYHAEAVGTNGAEPLSTQKLNFMPNQT